MRKPLLLVLLAPLILLLAGQTTSQPAPVNPELERLRKENAELKKQIESLRSENEKLRKQWAQAMREGSGGVTANTTPSDPPTSLPAASNKIPQDGPGMYRATSGRFTAEFRANSRKDAIDKALKTVGKKSMDFDENAEIGTLHVERIGN